MASLFASLTTLALVVPLFAGNDRLAELTASLKTAKTAETKISLLESIAELGKQSADETAKDATKALSSALSDQFVPVQVRSIELLGVGQDVDVAVSELLQRCRKYIKEEREIDRAIEKMVKESKELKVQGDLSSKDPKERKRAADSMAEILKQTKAHGDFARESLEVLKIRPALVGSFAALPDDRAVEGLGLLLANHAGADHDPLIRALLNFGTGSALKYVVASLSTHETRCTDFEKRIKQLKREKPGKNPDKRMSDDAWVAQELKRIATTITNQQEVLNRYKQWAELLGTTLRTFANDKGLEAPPAEILPARAWTVWSAAEGAKLPSSVSVK